MSEFDGKLDYDVQLRIRHEHEVGKWHHEVETIRNEIRVDGLKPGTTYDVRVRAWHGKSRDLGKSGKKFFEHREGRKRKAITRKVTKEKEVKRMANTRVTKTGKGGMRKAATKMAIVRKAAINRMRVITRKRERSMAGCRLWRGSRVRPTSASPRFGGN